MMDTRDEKTDIFNIKLAKLTSLYQILNPGTVKYWGRNVYHIIVACFTLYVFAATVTLFISALHCSTYNLFLSMDYNWKFLCWLYAVYKICIIVFYSNDLWNCLSIARYDFTSFSNRYRHILDCWRNRVVLILILYLILCYVGVLVFSLFPLSLSENKLPVKNLVGLIGNYRQNIINLYLIVSDETYNAHFYEFYIVEVLSTFLVLQSFLIFDNIMVTLCLSLCCHMQIINSAFESVGYKSPGDHNPPLDYTEENKNIPIDHDAVYDELITIIKDHQAVMEKYKNFLAIFGRPMLLQLFWSSTMIMMICFLFIMSNSNDKEFNNSKAVLQKSCFLLIPVFYQIFMGCCLFENLNNQKDSIIFRLYSGNWTKMDMKCKKLILLTMIMNNVNYKKLRYTSTKTVDMIMLFKTMGNCYTFITFLVNCFQRKVD